MDTATIEGAFKRHEGEHLKFARVQNKRSNRPDLHAFMLLDELVPGDSDMIAAAEHDQIFLSVEAGDIVRVASEEQIEELVRCGVRYDRADGLVMYA